MEEELKNILIHKLEEAFDIEVNPLVDIILVACYYRTIIMEDTKGFQQEGITTILMEDIVVDTDCSSACVVKFWI